jgi:hypothetical protein
VCGTFVHNAFFPSPLFAFYLSFFIFSLAQGEVEGHCPGVVTRWWQCYPQMPNGNEKALLVYIHIPHDKRTKLDPSGKKGIFVGYIETSKAYKVYVPGYNKIENDDQVILLLYVDDLFLTGNENLITDCKKKLASKFELKDLGQMHYFLGLEVCQNPGEICLSQGKYASKILKRFGMMDCKSMTTPMTTNPKLLCDTLLEIMDSTLYRQMIGSLMYLTNTRLDICFAVNTLSQYMVEPKHVYLIAAKHVMRYLKGTIEYGIKYDADCEFRLQGYSDSDWGGSVTDRKSTSDVFLVWDQL